jgi:FtsH-binding integral membrane protein
MKDIYHFFEKLGIDFALMLAGLFGGIAFISKPNTMNRMQKFITVLTGVGTANYLTPMAMYFLKLPNELGFALAFLLGFSGLKSIETLIKKYDKSKK